MRPKVQEIQQHTWLLKDQGALISIFLPRILHRQIVQTVLKPNIQFPANTKYVDIPGMSTEPLNCKQSSQSAILTGLDQKSRTVALNCLAKWSFVPILTSKKIVYMSLILTSYSWIRYPRCIAVVFYFLFTLATQF